MDLYIHIASPPARAAYVTAKHLGIDFNLKTADLFAGETRAPEYLKLNPSHTVPTLNDNGFFLFESRAIMTYLANQYRPDSTLYPKDPKKRATVDKILYFDASAVFAALRAVVRPKFVENKEPTQEAIDELKERISILEQLLDKQKFFAGDQVTLADISVGTTLFFFLDDKIVTIPDNIKQWYQRTLKEIPAMGQINNEAAEFVGKFIAERAQQQQK